MENQNIENLNEEQSRAAEKMQKMFEGESAYNPNADVEHQFEGFDYDKLDIKTLKGTDKNWYRMMKDAVTSDNSTVSNDAVDGDLYVRYFLKKDEGKIYFYKGTRPLGQQS